MLGVRVGSPTAKGRGRVDRPLIGIEVGGELGSVAEGASHPVGVVLVAAEVSLPQGPDDWKLPGGAAGHSTDKSCGHSVAGHIEVGPEGTQPGHLESDEGEEHVAAECTEVAGLMSEHRRQRGVRRSGRS